MVVNSKHNYSNEAERANFHLFEYLCYGSKANIKKCIHTVQGFTLDVRF